MRKSTSPRKEFYGSVARLVEESLGEDVVGIVAFGSFVYLGRGRDVDVLIVLRRSVGIGEKLKLERELAGRLSSELDAVFDVHVLSFEDFLANLAPGSFLSGLALGYDVLLDKGGVEDAILEFLERLSGERCILHDERGEWNLSHHARVTLELKKRRRSSRREGEVL